jgi:hypothetical protein
MDWVANLKSALTAITRSCAEAAAQLQRSLRRDGTARSHARSWDMKLLFGALAYLAFVGTLLAATFAGLSSLERKGAEEGPVLARGDDGAAQTAVETAKVDPNRVPVWITATPKYEYTPVPIDPRPRRSIVIGEDARNAMAKAPPRARPERQEVGSLEAGRIAAPRRVDSRRDNDPFFRD